MADRYAARHAKWLQPGQDRPKPNRRLLPAATALTIAGLVVAGTGVTMQLQQPGHPTAAGVSTPDIAELSTADRAAAADRANRDSARPTPSPSATGTATAKQPSGAGSVVSSGTCGASFYSDAQSTASGEPFNPDAYTAAARTLPFDTRVRVTNLANGDSVVVRINDRGPYVSGRCLDLSRASFKAIASLSTGVINIRYEVLSS